MPTGAGLTEAVIISGPRRGQVIRVPDEVVAEVLDDDRRAIEQALDEVIAAVDEVSREVRATTEALKRIPGPA